MRIDGLKRELICSSGLIIMANTWENRKLAQMLVLINVWNMYVLRV
jgi:hypothetical protein